MQPSVGEHTGDPDSSASGPEAKDTTLDRALKNAVALDLCPSDSPSMEVLTTSEVMVPDLVRSRSLCEIGCCRVVFFS